MDWRTFIATIIASLAWPAALVFLVLVLRKPIKELLLLLQRLKYTDLQLEFGKRVEAMREEVALELPVEAATAPTADESSALAYLADASPRSAVLDAWKDAELAALDLVRTIGGESFRNKPLTFQAIRFLEQEQSIERNVSSLLRELRALRGKAAYAPDFALSKESALEYAASASAVARYLRKMADAGKREARQRLLAK